MMATSFVSKTPSPISLPDGSYCTLFNEDYNGATSIIYYTDSARKESYTEMNMANVETYRCLQYKIYFDQFSPHVNASFPVVYIPDNDEIAQPIFECISPTAMYLDDKNAANVLFWTNLKPGESFKVEEGYKYDAKKVQRIKDQNVDVFENSKVTRALCSMSVTFRYLYVSYNISSSGFNLPRTLVPIVNNIVVLQQIESESPVLDFSVSERNSTTNSRHAHTNNSDCGFAFAVFHPGTGVPLGNPWKN